MAATLLKPPTAGSEEEKKSSKSLYSAEQLRLVDPARVPRHIAIVMDGNRRWARKRFLPTAAGHYEGGKALRRAVEAADELGVEVLTVYAFSTENWRRPPKEVSALMKLFEAFLRKELPSMLRKGIKLGTIGDIAPFPESFKNFLAQAKKETAGGDGIELVVALNYGGRDDLRRATVALAQDVEAGKLQSSEITEATIASYLDTAAFPDPDILIRTSGEQRLSNFLLWQISYAELFITETLWPDFTEKHLLDAVIDFQKRERRLGGAR